MPNSQEVFWANKLVLWMKEANLSHASSPINKVRDNLIARLRETAKYSRKLKISIRLLTANKL